MRSHAGKGTKGVRAALAPCVLALLVCVMASGSANAAFGVNDFTVKAINADGSPDTRAGGHPWGNRVEIDLRTAPDRNDPSQIYPDGGIRDLVVDLPVGFVGNPQAVPTCPPMDLAKVSCSPATQVGLLTLTNLQSGTPEMYTVAVFNMESRDGEVADFGFYNLGVPFHIRASLISGENYRIRSTVSNISQATRIQKMKLTLWGDPVNRRHDAQRGSAYACPFDQDDPICSDPSFFPLTGGGFAANIAPRPFISNPTTCGVEQTARVRVRSWENPGAWDAAATTDEPITDCDALRFAPTIDASFGTNRPDSPTNLRFQLNVPQNDSPAGIATPPLKSAKVTLPEGVSLNPSISEGLTGCTDAQIGLGTDNPTACANSSKVGDVAITTPLLPVALEGPIYLGEPVPGKTYRIFLVAESARYGVSLRLEGVLRPDPATGRITAYFENNPQLPFSNLDLRFNGGPRAPLATSPVCGTSAATSELTPWAQEGAAAATPSSQVTVSADGNGAPCPAPGFAPSFKAGGTTPVAGADTAFTLTFGREDGQRYLNDMSVELPKGLLGRISQVPLCADGAANAGACGAESQIGSTTVGAGAGAPFYLGGRVYLTGPYKGAPYGMSIVVPAIAGPFNLGTVVVRTAIHIDRTTTALRVVSDPLPSILDGIPLRMRKVNVTIDRQGFMFNPTNCKPSTIAAVIGALGGGSANVSSRFQASDCRSLPFKPKLTIRMGARGRTKAESTAPLNVSLAMTPGQANNRAVSVSLPRNVNARLTVINQRACTIEQFKSETCPQSDRIGTATAFTPLLRAPLRGDVFFVRNPARRIPDLMVALRGEVAVDLTGKVTVNRNLTLRTDFDTVPDVPITRFDLALVAGRNGPVGFVANACTKAARAERATVRFRSHSGRAVGVQQKMTIVGCGKATTRKSNKKAAKKTTQKAAGKK